MKNTRRLKFLSGVAVVLFLGFIMGGCQKEAIDSDMEGHWELLESEHLFPHGIASLMRRNGYRGRK